MDLLNKLNQIKDIKQKVDMYDKIIRQKLEYDLEILYLLGLLDSEMNKGEEEEDLKEDDITVDESTNTLTQPIQEDTTQEVLTSVFIPDDELKKNDMLDLIQPPAVSWDPATSDNIEVIKTKTSKKRVSKKKN